MWPSLLFQANYGVSVLPFQVKVTINDIRQNVWFCLKGFIFGGGVSSILAKQFSGLLSSTFL